MIRTLPMCCVAIWVFSSSCGYPQAPPLDGHLVVAWASTVRIVDLRSFEKLTVYQAPRMMMISHITSLWNESIIVDLCRAGDEYCELAALDLTRCTATVLRQGRAPQLLEPQGIGPIVFFYFPDEEEGREWLGYSHLGEIDHVRTVTRAPEALNRVAPFVIDLVAPPVPVSDQEVVFVGPDRRVLRFDIVRQALSETDITDCVPQALLGDSRRLLCYSWSSGNYRVVSLNGREEGALVLPLEDLRVRAYLPTREALFITTTRLSLSQGEVYDLSLYDLATGEISRIVRDLHVGAAVWRPGDAPTCPPGAS